MYDIMLLYGMYALLVVLSAIGGYLKIYTADVAQYVLLFVIGHFAGVMTPPIGTISPSQRGSSLEKKDNTNG